MCRPWRPCSSEYRVNSPRPWARAFTLIELLVVIVIIAILAALLLPVLSQTRANSRAIACLNNQKQLGLSIFMYADDYDSFYPTNGDNSWGSPYGGISWDDLISGYDDRAALPRGTNQFNGNTMKAAALSYDLFGYQELYLCASYRKPDELFYGTMRTIPRSYSLSHSGPYGPGFINPSAYKGVSGRDHSRTLHGIGTPESAIVIAEGRNIADNMLGYWKRSVIEPTTWRNYYTTGLATVKANHYGGLRANFLLADGHGEALSFQDTATKSDGSYPAVGPSAFLDTMWDSTK